MNNIWNKISKILGILSIILGVFYFIFSNFINIPKSKLEYHVITNTPLIDLKEDIAKLNIIYDSINFTKNNKNISIIILEISNNGNKNITTNDYDLNAPFGIKFLNSEIIKSPELTKSSDEAYFKDIISESFLNRVIFNKKIIDKDEFFQLKLYVIHNKNTTPKFIHLGKISGQKTINIIDREEINKNELEEQIQLGTLISILSTALITILSLLTLSLYKNNNILYRTKNMLNNKNSELLSEIEKLKK